MSYNWERFHSDCRQVSNISVICADGVIFTHKLVLAHISSLVKNILKEIPPADEATIYLKDFSKEEVEVFMSDASLSKVRRNTDLLLLLGDKSVWPVNAASDNFLTPSSKVEVIIKAENEDDWDKEKHINIDTSLNHSESPSDSKNEEFDEKNECVIEECKKNPSSTAQKMYNKRVDKKISFTKSLATHKRSGEENEFIEKKEKELIQKKVMDPDELEEFDRKTQEQIREYEKDFIENPKTEKQRAVNKKIDKKIKYEKALAALKTGRVKSYRQAAVLYGVTDHVLARLLTSGTSFKGKGCTLKRFTAEEEKVIVDRIWKLKEGGTEITNKMVQTILLEEAEIAKVNQPERTEQMTFATNQLLWSFTFNFMKRNEIDQICVAENRKDLEQRRIHECEICYKTFTYQNSLVAHRRKCHSFLFARS